MLALIMILTLLLNGRMVYVLKKRANNMTSMTSNQHSVTSAQASADAMRKLTLFVTGIISRLHFYKEYHRLCLFEVVHGNSYNFSKFSDLDFYHFTMFHNNKALT